MNKSILKSINKIPVGYSEGRFENQKYGITKTLFNGGNSIKIFGEELGGNNFISLNYYITKKQDLMKPCEMPRKKVIDFLEKVHITGSNTQKYKTNEQK